MDKTRPGTRLANPLDVRLVSTNCRAAELKSHLIEFQAGDADGQVPFRHTLEKVHGSLGAAVHARCLHTFDVFCLARMPPLPKPSGRPRWRASIMSGALTGSMAAGGC